MGNYNPHAPFHLGQEWVPIRDENLVYSPDVNTVERGHGFTTTQGWALQDARFYLNELPPGRALGQVYLATLYRRGEETLTGPIKKVIIPCNAVLVSGGATVVNSVNGPDAVANPSDNKYISFNAISEEAQFFFAANQYVQQLAGKRILGVDALYVAAVNATLSTGAIPPESQRGIWSLISPSFPTSEVGYGHTELAETLVIADQIFRKRLGEIDHFWDVNSPAGTPERLPWRFQGLQNMEIGASPTTRFALDYNHGSALANEATVISYVALEVTYCEESRIIYGGTSFGESGFTTAHRNYIFGANIITLRNTAYALNPVIAPDDYVVVLSSADIGDAGGTGGLEGRVIANSPYPTLNAARQYYALPPHPGVQVNVTQVEDDTFTESELVILPQLSVHVTGTGGPLTDVHVYGRQAKAPVYSSITASQRIDGAAVGVTGTYQQVRWYSRRFGETVIPLKLSSTTITGAGQTVQITPDEHDALPEIVDGWREVTLRFVTPVSMETATWVWSASGEASGNRWEVLGATAPAISGVPGNLQQQVPSTQRLGPATYMPPLGTTDTLTWQSPAITGTASDPASDAVLIFAQDPPTITGLAVVEQTQAVTGIGLDCGLPPNCVPTGIGYHRVTWESELQAECALFSTVTVTGWPATESGHAWTPLAGTSEADFHADGTRGIIVIPTGDTAARNYMLPVNHWDVDILVTFTPAQISAVSPLNLQIRFRDRGDNDYYRWSVVFDDDGTIDTIMSSIIGGATTTLDSSTNVMNYVAGEEIHVHVQAYGSALKARLWTGPVEPTQWTDEATEATFAWGRTGFRFILSAGNTNTNPTAYVTNLSVTPRRLNDAVIEIQRFDTIGDVWETIALTGPCLSEFRDYEARVGVTSTYRARIRDVLNFYGPWSSEVSHTLAAPGVAGVDVADNILIFTTNEVQDGSANLAYVPVWERSPEESFTFPEAETVELQRMYGRDYQVAFRPLERGGERFQRVLLVQAAAVSPPVLNRVDLSLRDLAWADVSYVCVRTEEGDRWLATVIVPDGVVRSDRTLQLARIDVIEVTATPSPVDAGVVMP